MEGYPDGLDLKPHSWPEGPNSGTFGTESEFVPQGFLLGAPAVMFPYRGMPSDDYYGAQAARSNPILDAPLQDPGGGTVYFAGRSSDDLRVLFGAMGVHADAKSYIAVPFTACDTVEERYLDQLRIVRHVALTAVCKLDEALIPAAQSMTIGDALCGFVEAQIDKWKEPGQPFSHRLSGTAGGDGDWAKEELAFGFHVENSHWGVYRIWSRAWLVTK
jgi:hypothetical protein